MADLTLSRAAAPAASGAVRPAWLDQLIHRVQVRRRYARHQRYLTLIGRAPRRHDWLGEIIRASTCRM